MLSTFNLPGKNISVEKQMSMMRTYLSELKDDIEKELYDIKWENLAKSLQDRINSLESYKDDSELRINTINAKYVDTDYLSANYATITNLNAATAQIDLLWANEATIGGKLTALEGNFNTLNAKAITTDNLSAQSINGSQITAGTITAAKISSTADLHINTITADGGYINIPLGTVTAARVVTDTCWIKLENFVFANRNVGWVSINGRYTLCAVE